jgi:tripartite-type tricarboxylate transporter receptor subunit TctC
MLHGAVTRRETLIGTIATLFSMSQARAADWPTKPVRLIVPNSAGGAADLIARTFTTAMAPGLGQQFVIDNRPGAGGMIATESVIRMEPDGYNLLLSGLPFHVLGPAINSNANFDAMRDYTHIAYFGGAPVALVVHPSLGVKTYAELKALAEKDPTGLDYVSPGLGTAGHVVAEFLVSHGKLNIRHVPYKGGGTAIIDLVAGHVKVGSLTWSTPLEHVRSGGLIPIAISTPQRLPDFPNLPTFAELGFPDLVMSTWFSLSGPAKMPPEIVERLNRLVAEAFDKPEVKKAMERDSVIAKPMTAPEFTAFMKSEVDKWTPLVRAIVAAGK